MTELKLTEQQHAAVFDRGGSLLVSAAAGSVNIRAHFPSYSNIYSAFFKFIFEIQSTFPAWTNKITLFYRVDRYQIDMTVLML